MKGTRLIGSVYQIINMYQCGNNELIPPQVKTLGVPLRQKIILFVTADVIKVVIIVILVLHTTLSSHFSIFLSS